MKPNWKKCGEEERESKVSKMKIIIFRIRIEVTADFDGMLGNRGFEYADFVRKNWFEIDGVGKFGLKEGEYKYIDDGVY